MICPHCESSLYFEYITQSKQADGKIISQIYSKCDCCHYEYNETTDKHILIIK